MNGNVLIVEILNSSISSQNQNFPPPNPNFQNQYYPPPNHNYTPQMDYNPEFQPNVPPPQNTYQDPNYAPNAPPFNPNQNN